MHPTLDRPLRRAAHLPCAFALSMALTVAGCGGGGSSSAGGNAPPADAAATTAPDGGRARALAAAPASGGGVVINEVVAGAWKGVRSDYGSAEDWVELHNPADRAVDLSGYGLSNKAATPFLWTFPAGTTIPARGYLTVWLSKFDRAQPGRVFHANFNLDNGGDTVYLTASNATATGIAIDSVRPPLLQPDQSWCRMPDGGASSPFRVCPQPTYNVANTGVSFAGIAARPTLSLASGFYDAAQTLTITGPAGATIRYTTDGSEPTAASAVYDAPLAITGARVVRAAAFADGQAPSLPATGTYVVDPAKAAQYRGLKAILVAIPPADKARFDAFDRDHDFRAHFEMVTGGTTSVFKLDAEGGAAGGAGSSDSPIRQMNVAARDAFGDKRIRAALWADKPGVTEVRKLRLRNGSNDWAVAHLRDQLAQRASADGPNLYGASASVAVFINGQYYALMDLREREDETLPAQNLGIDKDFVDFLENPLIPGQEIKNGLDAALLAYTEMHNFVTRNDMSLAANYARATALMNPDSLAWDWALHMYTANHDWPDNNTQVWRSDEFDSRWTWRPKDFDFAFGRYSGADYNMNGSFDKNGSQLINALLRNPAFRTLYLNTVADQMNLMTPAYLNRTLDVMAADMRPYVADYFAKVGLGAASNWETHIGNLRAYFAAREPIHDQHTRERFGLAARQAVAVSVSDAAMGTVMVNGLDTQRYVSAASPVWTGRYYPGVPITVKAQPRPGYAFVGWQGGSTSTQRTITPALAADATAPLTLRAVFAPAGAPAAPVVAGVAAELSADTGAVVKLQPTATDPGGYPLTWSATGLPKGVSIQPRTGRIFGRVTTPGVYASTLSATNGVSTGTLAVRWVISDRPGTGTRGTSPDSGNGSTPPPPPANRAPTVALTSPAGGTTVLQGAQITVTAAAADADGNVARVEFYAGTTLIETRTAAPFSATWWATPGAVALTARAVDNQGAATTSAPVTITVTPTPALSSPPPSNATTCASEFANCTLPAGTTATVWYGVDTRWVSRTGMSGTFACRNEVFGDPAPTVAKSCRYVVTATPNQAPTVALTAPAANTSVAAGTALTLTAGAADADGRVVRVEFYDGAALVASVTAAPYTARWSTTVTGTHVLTARAIDDRGATTTSAPVTVAVTAAPAAPPATGTGLLAAYYGNGSLIDAPLLRRTEAPQFDWGLSSPQPGVVPLDNFAVRWAGQLEAPVAGSYRLRTISDDGVRVWVDGRRLIDNWGDHSATADTTPSLALAAGQRINLVIEYRDTGWNAQLRLQWELPGSSSFAAVPSNRLYPVLAAPNPRVAMTAVAGTTTLGAPFIDPVDADQQMRGVYVRSGTSVDMLQALNQPVGLAPHGGSGGSGATVYWPSGEYLVGVRGIACANGPIARLSFVTQTGRVIGPYGSGWCSGSSSSFDLRAPTDHQVLGFRGNAGSRLESIGLVVGRR